MRHSGNPRPAAFLQATEQLHKIYFLLGKAYLCLCPCSEADLEQACRAVFLSHSRAATQGSGQCPQYSAKDSEKYLSLWRQHLDHKPARKGLRNLKESQVSGFSTQRVSGLSPLPLALCLMSPPASQVQKIPDVLAAKYYPKNIRQPNVLGPDTQVSLNSHPS